MKKGKSDRTGLALFYFYDLVIGLEHMGKSELESQLFFRAIRDI